MVNLNHEYSGDSPEIPASSEIAPTALYQERMIKRNFINLRDNLNRLKVGAENLEAKNDGETRYSLQLLDGNVIAITDFEQSRTCILTEEGARAQDMLTQEPVEVDLTRLAEIADEVERIGKKENSENEISS